jgi:hypothetical protein
MKIFQILTATILVLIISACLGNTNVPPTPTQQLAAPTYVDIPTRILNPTSVPAPTSVPTSTPVMDGRATPPAWVADFAQPILERVADQYTTFHDEFTAQLNHGWYYFGPQGPGSPLYAHLEEDTLILRMPDGNERRDSMVYSPRLARKNFVLSLDFKFGKTEPNDIFRLQFQQAKDESVILDFSKNETASLHWHLYNGWQSMAGIYDYFGPALVNMVIIMSDYECAVYINHDPFAYLDQCRVGPILQPVHEAVSLHLISTTGHPATITIDNVKMWDLDLISP